MKKSISLATATILIAGSLTTGCKTLDKLGTTTLMSTGIGCLSGLALGSVYDETQRKKDTKNRKQIQNQVGNIFKQRKAQNKGKIVGLGAGCLAGLGTGAYLDIMADDMKEQMASRGMELEKVAGKDGETDELLVKMKGDITFDTGKATLQGTGKSNVSTVADALKGYPETGIKVGGHSDGTGSAAVNLPLSEQRAKSVASALSTDGVAGSRILQVKGYGSANPLPGTNPTGADAKNRRVEIRIVPNK